MPTFDRGFKSWCERSAANLRQEMGLVRTEPLDPTALADHLGVELLTPDDVPGVREDDIRQLLVEDPWGWSAVTIQTEERCLVIYNPRKSRGRRASDIMHELAHLILGHHPGTLVLSQDGNIAMRSFNQKQEDEANWLAWALLLPRDALIVARRSRLAMAKIAADFGVTETLVKFRLRMTAVDHQLGRRSAKKPAS